MIAGFNHIIGYIILRLRYIYELREMIRLVFIIQETNLFINYIIISLLLVFHFFIIINIIAYNTKKKKKHFN